MYRYHRSFSDSVRFKHLASGLIRADSVDPCVLMSKSLPGNTTTREGTLELFTPPAYLHLNSAPLLRVLFPSSFEAMMLSFVHTIFQHLRCLAR